MTDTSCPCQEVQESQKCSSTMWSQKREKFIYERYDGLTEKIDDYNRRIEECQKPESGMPASYVQELRLSRGQHEKERDRILKLLEQPQPEDIGEPLSAREENAKRLRTALPSPSSYSKPVGDDSWTDDRIEEKVGRLMLHHRPAERCGTPVALMDPILAQVAEDCANADPTAQDCRFAEEVASKMSAAFPVEADRMKAIHTLFRKEFPGFPFERAISTLGITDGTVKHRSGAVLVNMVVKNEIGTGGGSAHVENACYAADLSTAAAREPVREKCVCPTLLIELAGPNMSLSGAVFGNVVLWDPVSPMVPLLWLPHSPLMLQAARLFAAIRRALPALDNFYSSIDAMELPPPRQLEYPYPGSFTDNCGNAVRFTYTGSLTTLVFSATTEQQQQVIVKFTRNYCGDAHRAMQAAGVSPALLGCEQLTNGWQMVVMQLVPDAYPWDSAMSRPAAALEEAVHTLHSAGFVHGDLRDPNVLVSGEGEEARVSIIDYSWAGRTGEARYPHFMSRSVQWPAGAVDGAPIIPEHDLWQMKKLLQLV